MPLTHIASCQAAPMIQYPTTAVASRPICASNLGSGCKLTLIDCVWQQQQRQHQLHVSHCGSCSINESRPVFGISQSSARFVMAFIMSTADPLFNCTGIIQTLSLARFYSSVWKVNPCSCVALAGSIDWPAGKHGAHNFTFYLFTQCKLKRRPLLCQSAQITSI